MKKISKKLFIIILSSLLVVTIGYVAFNNKNNEKEIIDHNNKADEGENNKLNNNEEWNALGKKQKYFQLNSEHLKREKADAERYTSVFDVYTYTFDDEFVDALFMMSNGFYNGASKENIESILSVVLFSLPNDVSARTVFDELTRFAIDFKDTRDQWVNGEGEQAN